MPWQREATSCQFSQLNWPVADRVALHALFKFSRLKGLNIQQYLSAPPLQFSQLNCKSTALAYHASAFPFTRLDLSLAVQAYLFGKNEPNRVNVKNKNVKRKLQFSQLNCAFTGHYYQVMRNQFSQLNNVSPIQIGNLVSIQFSQLNNISISQVGNLVSIQFSQLNCAFTGHHYQVMRNQFSQLNNVSPIQIGNLVSMQFSQLNNISISQVGNLVSIQFSQLNYAFAGHHYPAMRNQFSQLNYRSVRRKSTDGRPPHLDPRPPRTMWQQHKASVKRLGPFSFQSIYSKTSISRPRRQMDVRFYKGRP